MDEETTRRLERITAPASTSSPSSDVSARIASIESRQNEIASTLGEFAQSLNGESLNAASRGLVAEAQKNRAATASAIEGLKAQVTANQKLVSQVGGAVQRIEKRTEERVEKAVEQVAGEASATMTASLDASNARAERIIAATAKLEARQLWSAAAMCLVLLPVARGRRWPRRGRLRALRVRPLGCGSRGDLEGPRDAKVAPLAQEVITPHEGKRAQRVRQPRQLDIRSAAAV